MRKAALVVHRFTTLLIGGLLMISAITGSLLVFSEQIDAALNPGLLRVAGSRAQVQLRDALATVRHAYPGESVRRVKLPQHADAPYEFWLSEDFGGRRVYVNPFTAQVLGDRYVRRSFTGWVFLLHSELLSGASGKRVLGGAGVLAVVALATGLIAWWPGLLRIGTALRLRTNRWTTRRWLELHAIAGALLFPLLMAVLATGGVMAQSKSVEQFTNTVIPVRGTEPRSVGAGGSIDEVLKSFADQHYVPTYVYLRPGNDDAFRVRLRAEGESHPNGTTFADVSLAKGTALVHGGGAASVGSRLVRSSYVVHIGAWAGSTGRILVLIAGLAVMGLGISGTWTWVVKRRARMRVRRDVARACVPGCLSNGAPERGA